MRGSREISLVPSLHRASTDALIAPKTWREQRFCLDLVDADLSFVNWNGH